MLIIVLKKMRNHYSQSSASFSDDIIAIATSYDMSSNLEQKMSADVDIYDYRATLLA
jgi:hypothetical protein